MFVTLKGIGRNNWTDSDEIWYEDSMKPEKSSLSSL